MGNLKILHRLRISEESEKKILIVAIFGVQTLFTLYPWSDDTRYSFFPFFHGASGWDGTMTRENVVYLYCGHLAWLMVFRLLCLETGKGIYDVAFKVESVNTLEFALRYNHTWGNFLGIDWSWNIFQFVIILYYADKYRKIG